MSIKSVPFARERACVRLSQWVTTIAMGASLTFVTVTNAQTIQPREVAALSNVSGHTADSVWETSIAVGSTQALAVYHVVMALNPVQIHIGYALAELSGGNWSWVEEGIIAPSDLSRLSDPTVAYDAITGEFLVCALNATTTNNVHQVALARWDGTNFGSTWEILHTDPGQDGVIPSSDKPVIVAGEMLAAESAGDIHEFYITWTHSQDLIYLHTRNGSTWYSSCVSQGYRFALTNLSSCDNRIGCEQWPVPRVYGNRPLYVAYITTNPNTGAETIEVVRGDDVNSGSHAGEVQFTRLVTDSQGTILRVDLNRARDEIVSRLPGGSGILGGSPGAGLDMAVDPTNANRLYLVFHDTETSDTSDTDVNIYMCVLSHQSGSIWTVDGPVQVNDIVSQYESDQFMPSLKVDEAGVVHLIFYDDQKYNQSSDQQDGSATSNPKFDVTYMYTSNQGESWTTRELCDDPGNNCGSTEEAMDYNDLGSPTNFALRDYVGIDVGSDRVWTSFMGTSASRDPSGSAEKSLIWSSQILLP